MPVLITFCRWQLLMLRVLIAGINAALALPLGPRLLQPKITLVVFDLQSCLRL